MTNKQKLAFALIFTGTRLPMVLILITQTDIPKTSLPYRYITAFSRRYARCVKECTTKRFT